MPGSVSRVWYLSVSLKPTPSCYGEPGLMSEVERRLSTTIFFSCSLDVYSLQLYDDLLAEAFPHYVPGSFMSYTLTCNVSITIA